MCAGLVGISLTADWGEPVDVTNQRDIEAAERYIQFYLGWFASPLFNGDYPQVMKDYVGTSRSNDTDESADTFHFIVKSTDFFIPGFLFRQEERPAGPGGFTATRLLTSGEKLHQGNL